MKRCEICEQPAGIIFRKKLSDQSYICTNCQRKLPKTAVETISHLNTYDIHRLIQYEENEVEELNNIFIRTCGYGNLHLDEINGLFAICDIKNFDESRKIKTYVKDIFKCRDLSAITIRLIPSPSQKNKKKIIGDIRLIATLDNPSFNINTIIKKQIAVEYKESSPGFIVWDDPIELAYFKDSFNKTIEKIHIDQIKTNYSEKIYQDKEDVELVKAMAMFMIKDRNYTMKEVKEQRNRLLKTFHPDEGNLKSSEYASDINHYYEILIKNIK